MKRLGLILLSLLIMPSLCYAGQVTKPYTFSAGATIKSADVNSDFDTIYNEFNGSIEGGTSGNIAADTITETEMADDINPRVRWDEGFQDFVYTGLLPAEAAGTLTSNISAGTAYVSGYRVNKASATSKTYTASKETVVDLGYDGVFDYIVQNIGDTPAAVAANHIRLAYVGCDATSVDSVTDYRTLTPYSTGSSAHMITRGFELEWAGLTKVTVLPGDLYHNVTQVTGVSTALDIATATDYISGVSERGANKWLYVYCNSSGTLKLDDNAPDYADTNANTTGTKYYYLSGSYYRVLGAIRLNASQNIVQFDQLGDTIMYDPGISITTSTSNGAWSSATSCSAAIPSISTLGIFGLEAAKGTDNTRLAIRPNGGTGTTNHANSLDVYNRGSGQRMCFTDSSQQIQYQTGDNNPDTMEITVEGYILGIR